MLINEPLHFTLVVMKKTFYEANYGLERICVRLA